MKSRRLISVSLWALVVVAVLGLAAPASAQEQPQTPDCTNNGECDRSQYCAGRIGMCRGAGQCVVRPQVCPLVFDPVCGCDGQTYGNACEAHAAGVSIQHPGECKEMGMEKKKPEDGEY